MLKVQISEQTVRNRPSLGRVAQSQNEVFQSPGSQIRLLQRKIIFLKLPLAVGYGSKLWDLAVGFSRGILAWTSAVVTWALVVVLSRELLP